MAHLNVSKSYDPSTLNSIMAPTRGVILDPLLEFFFDKSVHNSVDPIPRLYHIYICVRTESNYTYWCCT